MNQTKTIGILAHVDAGKTTFSEQLLYHTNSIRQRGRVDHKDAFLDSHDIEKERGITVFADQGIITYNGSIYHLIDTPGHVDFSPEIQTNKLFPCASGSALQDIGVLSFLEKLDLLTVSAYKNLEPFAGRVYKVRYDENGTRITFIEVQINNRKRAWVFPKLFNAFPQLTS